MDLDTNVATRCNIKNERKQILIFDNGESDTEMKEEKVQKIGSSQAESKTNEKRFQCEICKKRFDLKSKLIGLAEIGGPPLNIVIEAPLSISFNKKGNPAGRSFEKSEKGSRYWYTNGGCVVMVSAGYLLRALLETVPAREIRLFEAFVSFKPKDKKSSHLEDVLAMREAVKKSKEPGIVVNHYEIAQKNHVVQSAFVAWGFDLGVPPVLKA